MPSIGWAILKGRYSFGHWIARAILKHRGDIPQTSDGSGLTSRNNVSSKTTILADKHAQYTETWKQWWN